MGCLTFLRLDFQANSQLSCKHFTKSLLRVFYKTWMPSLYATSTKSHSMAWGGGGQWEDRGEAQALVFCITSPGDLVVS